MSQAQVNKLVAEIQKAQKRASSYYRKVVDDGTLEDAIGYLQATSYMAGLCKAMESAAEQAAISIEYRAPEVVERILKKHRPDSP